MRAWKLISILFSNKNKIGEIIRIINKSRISSVNRKIIDTLYRDEINNRKIDHQNNDLSIQLIINKLQRNKWVEIPSAWIEDELNEIFIYLNSNKNLKKENHNNKHKKSEIWEYISDSINSRNKINENNPLVKVALNKKINIVVSDYLGQLPWLRYTLITKSLYTNKEYDYSQKWHIDFDDEKMIKMFVYLSDVDSMENGPFQFLNLETSKKVKNNFFRKHLSDSEIDETKINDGKIIMLGKKTKVFLVDTHRLYHCGSRLMENGERTLYTALFTAYPSIYPGAINGFEVSESATEYHTKILTPIR